MHELSDRGLANAQIDGDLTSGASAELRLNQGGTLMLGQPLHLTQGGGKHQTRLEAGVQPGVLTPLGRKLVVWLVTGMLGERSVAEDLMQPAANMADGRPCPDRAPSLQQGLLDHVLGAIGSHQSARGARERRPMALDQNREGPLVTTLGEHGQALIGLSQEQEIRQAWAHRRYIVTHAACGQSHPRGWTKKRGAPERPRSEHQPADPAVLGVEALPESVGAPFEPIPP